MAVEMTFELSMLLAAVTIFFLSLVFQGALTPIAQGLAWGLGSRDEPREPTVMQGRAKRLMTNHYEAMLMFIPLVLIAHLVGVSTSLTMLGASLFVGARAVYSVCYLGGVPYIRSLAWGVGVAGVVMIAVALLQTL